MILGTTVGLEKVCPMRVAMGELSRLRIRFRDGSVKICAAMSDTTRVRSYRGPCSSFTLRGTTLVTYKVVPIGRRTSLRRVLGQVKKKVCLSARICKMPGKSKLKADDVLSKTYMGKVFRFLNRRHASTRVCSIILNVRRVVDAKNN